MSPRATTIFPVQELGVQPIVVVGGRSARFGRDKLLEALDDGTPMVARPIEALRRVFGPCVAVVGTCNPRVAACGDLHLPDPYPGVGPIGGIVAALEWACRPVLVLSGDLPNITPEAVRAIAEAAARAPACWASVGQTDRLQPCIALYRPEALPSLRSAMLDQTPLRSAIPDAHRLVVPIEHKCAHNVNRPSDLVSPDGE